MYPFLSFGPLSIPTVPFFALLAGWLGLGAMARAGRRAALDPDQTFTAGLLAVAAGIIVARVWHVVQFWGIYRVEPLLMFSPRPGGLALWPGLAAAFIAAYLYLLRKRLDPVRMAAAATFGLLLADATIQIGGFLAGTVVGTPTDLPWALPYFEQRVHPVGLYRAAGALLLAVGLWVWGDFRRPGRLVLLAGLGYALVRLITDAFLAGAPLLGPFRLSQVAALAGALAASLALARKEDGDDEMMG